MDGGTKFGSEMATKRYFSGLEHRHTGEILDETHVSMAMRGDYLLDRYPRIGNENFETGGEKTDAILITVQWYPCRCIRVFLDGLHVATRLGLISGLSRLLMLFVFVFYPPDPPEQPRLLVD